jgi:hypothetical protein
VYSILCTRVEPLTEHDVRALLPAPLPNPAQALDALCYHGVIATDGHGYRTAGAMFRTWFATIDPRLMSVEEPAERDHVLESKQRRLEVLEQQQAIQGIATPPHVVLEIEDLQREIAGLTHKRGSSDLA